MSRYIPNQNTSVLKKWLPAIMGAIVLHLIVLFIFLDTQNHTPLDERSINAINTLNNPKGGAVIVNSNVTDSTKYDIKPDNLATITEDVSENTGSQSTPDIKEIKSSENKTNRTSQKISSKSLQSLSQKNGNEPVTADVTHESKTVQAVDNSLTAPKEDAKTATNNTDIIRQPTLDNKVSVKPAGANDDPLMTTKDANNTDKQLLTRDIPLSNQAMQDNNDYDAAAQEVEDINAKLSATINSVKEKNMREIAAIRAKDKATYLSDQQAKVNEEIAVVGEQLGVDELADSEFSEIKAD